MALGQRHIYARHALHEMLESDNDYVVMPFAVMLVHRNVVIVT